MNLLFLSEYTYNDKYPFSSKTKTGFGISTNRLLENLDKNVYVLTRSIKKETIEKNIIYIKISKVRMLILAIASLLCYPTFLFNKDISLKEKGIYYYDIGLSYYANKIIKKKYIDIVLMQGASTFTYYSYIKLKNKVPIMLTLRGFLSHNEKIKEYSIKQEDYLINEAIAGRLLLNVISTGMADKIKEKYNYKKDILVINNGLYLPNVEGILINHKKSSIKKITLIGSITQNKNQLLLVEAAKELSKLRKDFRIQFIGGGNAHDVDNLINKIDSLKMRGVCKYYGYKNSQELRQVYLESDLVVLISKSEGFGNSIVEAFSYGVPVVVFNDLMAFKDIYNENCVIASNRSLKNLTIALNNALDKEWNINKILMFAKKFKIENTIKIYNKALDNLLYEFKKTN